MAKILLVDDSATQAACAANLLFRNQHDVKIEACGEAGLARALHDEFDLIILDLNLPDLDGLEVCRRYKLAGNTTPVLLVSSADQLSRLNLNFPYHPDGCCVKDAKEFLPRVEITLLRQRRKLIHHRN